MADERKPTGFLQDPIVKYAALGVGLIVVFKGFGVIDKILEWVGLQDSQATKHLNDTAGDSTSYWTPAFWQKAPNGALLITSAAARQDAQDIYDAMGAFNDDEDAVKGVVRRMKTQSQFSYLSDTFESMFHQDLLSFLRGGNWPQDRLSDADVDEIDRFVSSLPKYFTT